MKKWSMVMAMMMLGGVLFGGGEQQPRGRVCFTFDDARCKEWIAALPLFEKYHAHATFFFNGAITPEIIDTMKQLQAAGHSIGLHTVDHLDSLPAMDQPDGPENYVKNQLQPQLDACKAAGLTIHYLAYPNNVHSDAADRYLATVCGFRRFRAGVPGHHQSGLTIAQDKQGFYTAEQVENALTLGGFGIGEYYHSTQSELDEALEETARTGTLLVFFSHRISATPKRVDVTPAMLEACLKKARELNLEIVSFNELSQQQ